MSRSLGLLALLTLAWGVNWPITKLGVSTLPPLWFRAIALLFGTSLLGVLVAARGGSLRVPRALLPRLLALSLPNVVVWYAVVTIALTMLPAGRAALLGFTMPVWSAVLDALFHRERLDGRIVVGVGCALVAVVLLVAGDWSAMRGSPVGVALMLFAAVSWAWGTHLVERSPLPIDTPTMTFWMFALACPVLFVASAGLEHARWRAPYSSEWWSIGYNAVLVIAVGNLIWFTLARRLPPTTAGLSTMLIPVVGVASSALLLGEVPSWRDGVALALVCAAIGLALRPTVLRKGGGDQPAAGTNEPS